MRASGLIPRSAAKLALVTTTAAPPSFSGQALPAVIRPSSRKTGFRPASFSTVVPGRGPSSRSTTVPSASVTGVISASKKPSSWRATASCWERAANSSISSRVIPSRSATFSAV